MRKTVTIICVVLLIAFLLVPMVYEVDDGGSVIFAAPLYSVTLQSTLWTEDGMQGRLIGTVVRVLFLEVYDDVTFVPEYGTAELPVRGEI